jgi:hypothetical protein
MNWRQLSAGDFAPEDDGSFHRDFWEGIRTAKRLTIQGAKFTVLAPVSLFSFFGGLGFPDKDISVLGIGYHRFFAFHSGLVPYALKKLYDRYLREYGDQTTLSHHVLRKAAGVAGSAFAFGVGLHLLVDVFQPKSVVFPGFGSLVDGTLIDDDLWLIGNSVWCFKIARDLLVLSCAPELESARAFVRSRFQETGMFGFETKR